MKKFTPPFVILSNILFVGVAVYASSYFAADFMSISDATEEVGDPYSEQFKSGDLHVGKSRKELRRELGDPDSYFFSDTIYAYKIMPFPGENKENWASRIHTGR